MSAARWLITAPSKEGIHQEDFGVPAQAHQLDLE
jgi:hypothetical protein